MRLKEEWQKISVIRGKKNCAVERVNCAVKGGIVANKQELGINAR